MVNELPVFRYHPNALRSGSLVERNIVCIICRRERPYAYVGPIYGRPDVGDGSICPWCIADGSAAATLQANFVDGHDLAGLAEDIKTTVMGRTPGYISWQGGVWRVHCDDACAFLDRVGRAELEQLGPEAIEAVRAVLGDWGRSESDREQILSWLHRDGDFTGYLFQCLQCGRYLGHIDSS